MKVGVDHNQVLAQMNRLKSLAQTGSNQVGSAADVNSNIKTAEFGNLLTKALDTVNQYQQASAQAGARIEAGDGGASLVKAMIASQKANIAFQTTVQVRNKVVSAYQDIMNMPI